MIHASIASVPGADPVRVTVGSAVAVEGDDVVADRVFVVADRVFAEERELGLMDAEPRHAAARSLAWAPMSAAGGQQPSSPLAGQASSLLTKGSPTLRRDLGLVGAVAVSLAVMGPSMSVSLNPQAMAEQVGPAVPTVFAIAIIPVLIMGVSFVVLTRRHGTAGSLYGLVGAEMGPRAGSMSGLWLIGAYVGALATTTTSFGIFMIGLVGQVSGATPAEIWTYVAMAVGLGLAIAVAMRPAEGIGRLLLGMEGLTMGLILVTMVLVLARLLGPGGPQGQRVEMSDFSLAGVGTGALGLALTFAILSTVGFEGAAAAGEETRDPLRNIPRAIVIVILVSSVFYIAVSAVGVWAFGTSGTEIKQFVASASLPGDIAAAYLADWLGDVITLGGAVSSLACMIAAQVAGGRMLYAFGRDGVLPSRLGRLSPRWGTPVAGGVTIGLAGALLMAVLAVPASGVSFELFEAVSDFTGVIVLAAYGSACVAAMVVLARSHGVRRLAAIVPAAGIGVVAAVLGLTLFPLPTGWELAAPVTGVIAIGVLGILGWTLSERATGRRVAS